MKEKKVSIKRLSVSITILMLIIFIIVSSIWGLLALSQIYGVWSQSKNGEALLAESQYSRQVLVQEAKSKEEAATYSAQADIIRANGIAKANKIIGDSLNNNSAYLEWKFIDELPQQKNQIIYLPTDKFLPVTEAGRGKQQ